MNIDFTKQTLETCFSGSSFYVIPDYQREYVWEEEHLKPLLDDFIGAFHHDAAKQYFVGTIVVYKGDNVLEVIDGQQRLTTFFIFLCVLRRLYERYGEDPSTIQNMLYSSIMNDYGDTIKAYRLVLQYQDATGFLEKIFAGTIKEEDILTASQAKLAAANKYIENTLMAEFDSVGELKQFAAFVLKRILFVQIETKDLSEALKIFETINQRGAGLNPMDLLKNLLFMQVSREQFKELNLKWRSITQLLEEMKEQPLRFLRYYIMANYDTSDLPNGIIREDQVYDWLVTNNGQCHYREQPFLFVNDMIAGVNKYKYYLLPPDDSDGNAHIQNIIHFAGKQYKLHLQLLLAAKKMNTAALKKWKAILESIVYYALMTRTKTNILERQFAQWCPKLREITNVEELDVFVSDFVVPAVDFWKQTYKPIFMSTGTGSIQQYRIRFILGRIGRYVEVECQSQGEAAVGIAQYVGKGVEIEHIMPWTCDVPGRYDLTAEEYDIMKKRLGNLALLEKSLNASVQNKPYDQKCKTYAQSKFYLTKSLDKLENVGGDTAVNKMNSRLKCWTEWTGKTIEERQEMLYELGESIWAIRP